ncbi:hypothetical protein GE061_012404 [Apolygus lucorum]|uniref:Uncharacterized protein n=1 Tax=Apolygus lucorum TaxID=248454 RepID=A0A8S9XSH7_APOLU|nr:hypothetical protein GE061_012404 [Apolygus lucorum]
MESKAAMESIHRRIGHITVPYKMFVLVWSGFVGAYGLTRQNPDAPIKHRCKKNEKTCNNVRSTYCPTDIVWFYNCLNGVWKPRNTTGDIPRRTSGSSAAVLDDHLYIFGGMIEFAENNMPRHQSYLYRLHIPSLVWKKLSPRGINPPRSDKGVSWAYNNKIYFFGGYGPRPDLSTIDYVFQADIANSNGRMGWNNNFFGYDPSTNSWFKPNTKGVTPDPRAAHSACLVNNRAFMFGGRLGETRTNDLYFINMDTLTWSRNVNTATNADGPEGRSWLSFNFVTKHKAVVYGGLRQYGMPAMDYWECDFSDNYESLTWTKCVTPIEPRVWHQAAFCENTHELVIVGGVSKSPYDMEEEDHVNHMKIIPYEPTTLYRLSLNAVVDMFETPSAVLNFCFLPKVLLDLVISRIQNGQYDHSCNIVCLNYQKERLILQKNSDDPQGEVPAPPCLSSSITPPNEELTSCKEASNAEEFATSIPVIQVNERLTTSKGLTFIVGASPVSPTPPNQTGSQVSNAAPANSPRKESPYKCSMRVNTLKVPTFKSYITPEKDISDLDVDSSAAKTPRSHRRQDLRSMEDIKLVESSNECYVTPERTLTKKEQITDFVIASTNTIKNISPAAMKTFAGVAAIASGAASGNTLGVFWGAATAASGAVEFASIASPVVRKMSPLRKTLKNLDPSDKVGNIEVLACVLNGAADIASTTLDVIAENNAASPKKKEKKENTGGKPKRNEVKTPSKRNKNELDMSTFRGIVDKAAQLAIASVEVKPNSPQRSSKKQFK